MADLYKAINMIRSTGSTKKKQVILKKYFSSYPGTHILYYTYDPMKMYGVRETTCPNATKYGSFTIEGSFKHLKEDLLDPLIRRVYTGDTALRRIKKVMSMYTADSQVIIRMMLLKSFKFGMSIKSINKVFPGLLPEEMCQLVEDWNRDKVKYPVFVSPKIDGVRTRYTHGQFYSRRGKLLYGLDHLKETLSIYKSLYRRDLDAELYIPGMTVDRFDEMSGIIRTKKHKLKGKIVMAVLDIPCEYPLYRRCELLKGVLRDSEYECNVYHIPHILVNHEHEVNALYKHYLLRGYEGVVVKQADSIYEPKRSFAWMRKVPSITVERKVVQVEEGTGRNKGRMGSLILDCGTKVGTGFTDDMREKYYQDPVTIIGKRVTIIAKGLNKSGILRQPRFKGVRWDIK